ncbi:ATP-NAD kinase family protein [Miniphocaeibacter halophilus]|uniref:ATP-NAD kinase family protein n=1 Tax=Miniphocaeibacter halophilus TaxID=2931922 RepID=A0AC61MT18_9FIRM|nr:ATP-NAD kinase family protein [Miniphocaeibacter halophilus]QQK08642.1 ATP-NAD kinase family protein [Miniphocaeibacter halophilus]
MKLGLIINPVAGIGGSVGLKGSDGEEVQKLALEKGGTYQANKKAKIALNQIKDYIDKVTFITGFGEMGENALKELGFSYKVVGENKEKTTFEDTENLAKEMVKENIDLLVFAGGDGTARNIFNAVELSVPCVGIPAGVKIHSAVYANNPKDAGLVIKEFIKNPKDLKIENSEVMDIDEDKFRQNIVEAKLYGYLQVPRIQNLMQGSKSPGSSSEDEIEGMSAEIEDRIKAGNEDTCYIFGTGGTTYAILKDLGFEGSLLGVDILYKNELVIKDGTEGEIYDFIKDKEVKLIVTAIGGQGHIFGRGNQQLSPRVLRKVGKDNIWIVASHSKLYGIPDSFLRIDTSDEELDKELSGYYKVIMDWKRIIVYKAQG